VRVPLAPAGGQRRGKPAAQAARGLPEAQAAQGAWPAADRRDPRRGVRPVVERLELVGEDGFALLDRLDRPESPEGLGRLPTIEALRRVWERHFVRGPAEPPAGGASVRLRGKDDPPPAAEPVESPYDAAGRFRTRSGTAWTGYVVHLSETCQDDMVHLLTHVMTTVATVHEARCTAAIHQALAGKGLTPGEHLVEAAYVDAELLDRCREELGIDLVGPTRPDPSWPGKVEGGYTIDRFEVDWDKQWVRCPQGKLSSAWSPQTDQAGTPYISVMFRQADCAACLARGAVADVVGIG
jgi:transposase